MIATLTLDDLAVRRGGRLLFEGVSLRLAAGEAAVLTGRNGAGKTSLLRAIVGLVGVESGAVGFGGVDPAEARADFVHFVGHHDGLKTGRTVREELVFWARWLGGADAGATDAAETLELVGLLDLEVRRLSAGQRRRLALARLLASPRSLWLLDEPMSPLDSGWRVRFGEIMGSHLAAGGLIVAAVHDPLPIPAQVLEVGG